MVEEDCADVIQMSIQSKEAAARLMRPHFDLVVITTRHEKWLCFVEVDASYWSIVFFKAVDEGSHSVIP